MLKKILLAGTILALISTATLASDSRPIYDAAKSVVQIDVTLPAVRTDDSPIDKILDPKGSIGGSVGVKGGVGSGWYIDENTIATNCHVGCGVKGEDVKIVLTSGQKVQGTFLFGDKELDISFYHVDVKGVPLKLEEEHSVTQTVYAIGNPFNLGETISRGIITAPDRNMHGSTTPAISIDAAVNPGNSGGALVNEDGHLIGMNEAIFAPGGSAPAFAGIAFSIPTKTIEYAWSFRDTKLIKLGLLGISLAPASDFDKLNLSMNGNWQRGYDNSDAVVVAGITDGSPAEGILREGDVILAVGGKDINDPILWTNTVDDVIHKVLFSPERPLTFVVLRDTKVQHLEVTPGVKTPKDVNVSEKETP